MVALFMCQFDDLKMLGIRDTPTVFLGRVTDTYDYQPNATSRIIMTEKPAMVAIVTISIFSYLR